jgi:hypothetical protein
MMSHAQHQPTSDPSVVELPGAHAFLSVLQNEPYPYLVIRDTLPEMFCNRHIAS